MFTLEKYLTKEEEKELCMYHKTANKGSLFLAVRDELEHKGYEVETEKVFTRFQFENGKRIDFDMLIRKGKEIKLISVEDGSYDCWSYFARFDKCLLVDKDIAIITGTEKELFNMKSVCFRWLIERFGSWEQAKNKVTFHFNTLEKLQTGNEYWEIVHI